MNYGSHKSIDPNPLSPVCTFCAHFDITRPSGRECRAFAAGIPKEIWEGRNSHTQAYPGDNGIQFEHVEAARADVPISRIVAPG